ncbi:MAG: hypothetical protein LBE17_02060 [Treponema sp.]|nr:hypothetical protein [Treponema sp.]
MIRMQKTAYNGWPNCIEIENPGLRLIVTTDVGPRIIYCGAADSGFNLFYEKKEQQGKTDSKEWLIYGGHRLWHSPQAGSRPNQADNGNVAYEIDGGALTLNPPEEPATRVQKQMLIRMAPDEPRVTVRHRIYNRGLWPVTLAPWALTVMREGGTEIFPIPQDKPPDYMPNYAICFWPWTRPNDHRFVLGERYMTLRQDEQDEHWFKIGYRNTEGWGAYLQKGYMFVKLYPLIPGGEYPDYGSTFETYTDNYFIELESLGPLKNLEPGDYTEHTEEWYVFSDVPFPASEAEIEEQVTKRILGIIHN